MSLRSKSTFVYVTALIVCCFLALIAQDTLYANDSARGTDAGSASDSSTAITLPNTPPEPGIIKMARIKVYVMEWNSENFFDLGFSALYQKALDDGGIVDALDLTFPLQNESDLGLKMFFDNLNVKNGLIEASVELLERSGKLDVLAEPEITLKEPNGSQGKGKKKISGAQVHSGSNVPYGTFQTAGDTIAEITQFKETGVTMIISLVDITDDGFVELDVEAAVTDLTGFVAVATDGNGNPLESPETSERSIDTTVFSEDGKPLIVGILKNSNTSKVRQGVPILSRIPLIGALFGSTSLKAQTRELVFIVVSRIIIQKV